MKNLLCGALLAFGCGGVAVEDTGAEQEAVLGGGQCVVVNGAETGYCTQTNSPACNGSQGMYARAAECVTGRAATATGSIHWGFSKCQYTKYFDATSCTLPF